MSDGLTAPPTSARPDRLDQQPARPGGWAWLVVPAQALTILVVFGGVGVALGRLWYRLWDVPGGVVSGGQWYTSEAGLRGDFQGVAWYVALSLVAGLVLG